LAHFADPFADLTFTLTIRHFKYRVKLYSSNALFLDDIFNIIFSVHFFDPISSTIFNPFFCRSFCRSFMAKKSPHHRSQISAALRFRCQFQPPR